MADLANRRFWVRAVETKVSLPDNTLVMGALEKAVHITGASSSGRGTKS